jgi:hypothetical protein
MQQNAIKHNKRYNFKKRSQYHARAGSVMHKTWIILLRIFASTLRSSILLADCTGTEIGKVAPGMGNNHFISP